MKSKLKGVPKNDQVVQWFKQKPYVAWTLSFAVIGLITLALSHAATPFLSIEAEDGSPSGVVTGTIASASNGGYVQFKTAGSGGGGGGTTGTGGTDTSCIFQMADKPVAQAFCDAFSAAKNGGTQTGDLDPVLYGVSRVADFNPGSILNGIVPSHNACTGGGTTGNQLTGDPNSVAYGLATPPPNDVKICHGQVVESYNDGGGVGSINIYPKQPFNFTGRTGTVVFDVSNDTTGSHGAWPEFVITDKPVPGIRREISFQNPPHAQNSFGFSIDGGCAGKTGVGQLFVITNGVYSEPELIQYDNCIAKGTLPNQNSAGIMNHFEVRVSQTRIDVYGTDAGSSTIKHLVGANVSLNFTQGLVWMDDVHYNARKAVETAASQAIGTQYDHSFAWDNLGFDGPKTYRDVGYDVPYNTALGGTSSNGEREINLGYLPSTSGQTWTLRNVVKPATAPTTTTVAAQVVLNEYSFDNVHAAVSINGNTPHTIPWIEGPDQFDGDKSYHPRSISIPIPINEVVNGDNTIKISGSDSTVVTNISLIIVAGAAVP
jgi:hypothetical protein